MAIAGPTKSIYRGKTARLGTNRNKTCKAKLINRLCRGENTFLKTNRPSSGARMLVDESAVIEELVDAFAAHGIIVDPADITESSKPRRIRADGDGPKVKDAWFVLHLDGRPAGSFGHHSKYPGESFKFLSKAERAPETFDQRRARLEKQERDREAKEAEQRRRSARTAENARRILTAATLYAHQEHAKLNGYLDRKDIVDARGVMFGAVNAFDPASGKPTTIENAILVPMLDVDGNLRSLQAIFNDADNVLGRDRTYLPGTQKTGLFFSIGDLKQVDGADVIVVCEGVATGLQIWRATGHAVRVAFDAGNLEPVAQALRGAHQDATIIIAGDHDRWKTPGKNPGLNAMFQAAAAVSGMPIWPPFMESDGQINAAGELRGGTDWDDWFRLRGAASVRGIFDAVLRQVRSAKRESQEVIDRARKAALPVFTDVWALPRMELDALAYNKHLRNLGAYANMYDGETLHRDAAAYAWALCLKRVRAIPARTSLARLMYEIKGTGAPLHDDTLSAMNDALAGMCDKRRRAALSQVSVSPEVLARHNHEILSQLPSLSDADYNGVILLWAPMASGKTLSIGKPFAAWAKDAGQGRLVATCHRRSLVKELAKVLDVAHYESVDREQAVDVDALATCLPSITKEAHAQIMDECRFMFVDEIAQVLCFIQAKECSAENGTNRDVYLRLQDMVRRATCIIGADAGMDDRVVEFLEACRPGEKFRIVEVTPKNESLSVDLGHGAAAVRMAYAKAAALLENGKRVWISCESKKQARKLADFLVQDNASKKILVIDADNSTEDNQAAFLADANVESRKYDAVIHSPTISSGLSITHRDPLTGVVDPHFDHGMFIGGGFAITPADAMQMLRRVRYLAKWTVVTQQNNRTGGIEDAADMVDALEDAAALEDRPAVGDEFTMFVADIKVSTTLARTDFAAGLYWVLDRAGFDVEDIYQAADQADGDMIAQIGEKLDEQRKAAILAAPDLTADEADRLRRAERRSEAELHALVKFDIKRGLGVDALEQDGVWDAWEDGFGLKAIDRFMAAFDVLADLRDRSTILTHRKYDKARARAYIALFAGIEIKPGMVMTQAQACTIVERAIANRMMLVELGMIAGKFGRKLAAGKVFPMPKQPMRDAIEIFNKIGIEFAESPAKDGVYVMGFESFAFMHRWAGRRRAAVSGINFVEPQEPTAPTTLEQRVADLVQRGAPGVSLRALAVDMLLEAINAELPADQHLKAAELARPLRLIGMVRYGTDDYRMKWRGKPRRVWIVGGVAATNAAVHHALNATIV